MESLGNLGRIDGFRSNLDVNGKAVTLATGESFRALIYDGADISPELLLGDDIRESTWVETLREMAPAKLLADDAPSQVDASIDGVAVRMTRRRNGIAVPFIKFQVVKVLGCDT